jgi:hypothetical protein
MALLASSEVAYLTKQHSANANIWVSSHKALQFSAGFNLIYCRCKLKKKTTPSGVRQSAKRRKQEVDFKQVIKFKNALIKKNNFHHFQCPEAEVKHRNFE